MLGLSAFLVVVAAFLAGLEAGSPGALASTVATVAEVRWAAKTDLRGQLARAVEARS
jgi:hypothetical protein